MSSTSGHGESGPSLGAAICARIAQVQSSRLTSTQQSHVDRRVTDILGGDVNTLALPAIRRLARAKASAAQAESVPRSLESDEVIPGSYGRPQPTSITWQGQTLVWTTSSALIRTFGFEKPIEQALWAWLDTSSQATDPGPSTASARPTPAATDELQHQLIAQHIVAIPDEEHKSSNKPASPLVTSGAQSAAQLQLRQVPSNNTAPPPELTRALCVFVPGRLSIFVPSTGASFEIEVPFKLQRAMALDVGVLMCRAHEREDELRASRPFGETRDGNWRGSAAGPVNAEGAAGESREPLDNLFYLRRPHDDLEPATIADEVHFPEEAAATPSSEPGPVLTGHRRIFNTVGEALLRVTDRSEGPPVVVTANQRTGWIKVYAIAHSPVPFDSSDVLAEDKTKTGWPAPAASSSALGPAGLGLAMGDSSIRSDKGYGGLREGDVSSSSVADVRPPLMARLSSARKSQRLERRASEGMRRQSSVARSRQSSGRLPSGLGPGGAGADQGFGMDTQMELEENEALQLVGMLDDLHGSQASGGIVGSDLSQGDGLARGALSGPAGNTRMGRASRNSVAAAAARTPYTSRQPSGRMSQTAAAVAASRARRSSAAQQRHSSIGAPPAVDFSQASALSPELDTHGSTAGLQSQILELPTLSEGNAANVGNEDGTAMEDEFEGLARGYVGLALLESIREPALLSLESLDDVVVRMRPVPGRKGLWRLDVVITPALIISLEVNRTPSLAGSQGAASMYTLAARRVAREGDAAEHSTAEAARVRPRAPAEQVTVRLARIAPVFCKSSTTISRIQSQAFQKGGPSGDKAWFGLLAALGLCRSTSDPFKEGRSAWEILCASPLSQSLGREGLVKVSPAPPSAGGASWKLEAVSGVDLASLARVLHVLAQDLRLESSAKQEYDLVVEAALALSLRLGWSGWVDYYARLAPRALAAARQGLESASPELAAQWPEISPPVDLYDGIVSAATTSTTASVPAIFGVEIGLRQEDDLSAACPRLRSIIWLAASSARAGTDGGTSSEERARAIVEGMVSLGLSSSQISSLPDAISRPLRACLGLCRARPPQTWPAEAYRLVGRPDLAGQFAAQKDTPELVVPREKVRPEFLKTLPRGTTLDPICGQLFPHDYRLRDVAELLQTSKPVAVPKPDVGDVSDNVLKTKHTEAFAGVAERIKAISIGRGMFTIASKPLVPTRNWVTPSLCFDLRMVPDGVASFEESGSDCAWPEFHNGVAHGLEMAVGKEPLDSAWIYSHRGRELSAKHAGFLFALGLLGQLGSIGRVHVMRYLNARHSLTSIALILGIGVSLLGSGDRAARHVIALHVKALLPPDSRDLQLGMLEQAAGLLSMGLLFMATCHKWTARKMLAEIGAPEVETKDSQMLQREAYSLSAGFALGLVMLGRGRSPGMESGSNRQLVSKLEDLIRGPLPSLDSEPTEASFHWSVDANTTATPATLALALIYLRSDDEDVARKIPMPTTARELDAVRPDMLLIRVLGRCLIMWSSIEASPAFVESVLPPFVAQKREPSQSDDSAAEQARQMARINMRLGACFAVALRFAGSADRAATGLLWSEWAWMDRDSRIRAKGYFAKIRQTALRSGADLLLICLGMVNAGRGDVRLLQIVRKAHGATDAEADPPASYGSQVAAHMALGLAFLGGGRFTLGTSDSAVAAMVMAFYPLFPLGPTDNRSHLQACRHLWALAVEPRLLLAYDVEGREVSSLPVDVVTRGAEGTAGSSSVSTRAALPSLLPQLESITAVTSACERYWPVQLDVGANPRHARSLLATRMLHVKRRAGFLSISDDPLGVRSLMLQARSHAARAPLSLDTAGLEALFDPDDVEALVHSCDGYLALEQLLRWLGSHERSQEMSSRERAMEASIRAILARSLLDNEPTALSSQIALRCTPRQALGAHALEAARAAVAFAPDGSASPDMLGLSVETPLPLPEEILNRLGVRQALARYASAIACKGFVDLVDALSDEALAEALRALQVPPLPYLAAVSDLVKRDLEQALQNGAEAALAVEHLRATLVALRETEPDVVASAGHDRAGAALEIMLETWCAHWLDQFVPR